MIFELRAYVLAPGRLDDYVAAAELGRTIRGDEYGKLEGHWSPFGGNLDRVVHLWSFADLAERDRLRARLAQNARWADEFLVRLPPLVLVQENEILSPVRPFAPAPPTRGQLYELCVDRVRITMVRPWLEQFTAAMPARERHAKNVGVWQTTIGTLNQVVHLWAHPSAADFVQAREALLADETWRAFLARSAPMLAESKTELLSATRLSPMG